MFGPSHNSTVVYNLLSLPLLLSTDVAVNWILAGLRVIQLCSGVKYCKEIIETCVI